MDTAYVRERGWAGTVGERSGEDDWTPPTTRDGLDAAILSLSNDIGLILAQLAEDQDDWCRRTGRDQTEYALWRRRALFAKVHKERQLRECKISRARLTDRQPSPAVGNGPHDAAVLHELCRRVVAVWGAHSMAMEHPADLDAAVLELADYLALDRGGPRHADLIGRRSVETGSAH